MSWDDDDESSEYPRRGKYGDPTPRCAWCGKPVDFGTRCCIGGSFNRYYCSYSCRAAGDFYVNGACSGIMIIALMIFLVWMSQVIPTSSTFAGLLVFFLALFTMCGLPTWSCLILGYIERKKEDHI